MKKFLVGIVAALMLFAFVACDNSVPTVSFKDVSYVEIKQVNDLIVGETAKTTDFQVVVNYTEGDPIIIPGNENNIDLTTTAGFATYKGDSPFKNVYGQTVPVVPVAVEKQTIVSVSANVSTVELVENTSSASSTVESPVLADPEALSDLEITLTGDAGATRTFTAEDILNKEITFVFSLYKDGKMLDRDYELKADETYNVTLDEYRFADDGAPDAAFNPGLETGVTVNVVEATEGPTEVISGIQAKYTVTRTGEEDPIAKDVTSLSGVKLFIGDEVTITLYNIAQFGDKDTSAPITTGYEYVDDNEKADISFTSGVATVTVKAAAQSGTAYYRIANVGTKSVDIEVPAGANAVVLEGSSLTVKQNDAKLEADTVLTGGQDITANVEFGSGAGLKNLNGEKEVKYAVTIDPARTYTVSETSQKVWIVVTFDSYEGTVEYPTTVDIVAKAGV